MKIALFYGHAASNRGDLAGHTGVEALVRNTRPDAFLTVVLFPSAARQHEEACKRSFSQNASIRFVSIPTDTDLIRRYLHTPERLFQDLDITDVNAVLINAGEHFFASKDLPNRANLFWRTLPIVAARSLGKKTIVLPSTLGPFDDALAREATSSVFSVCDAIGVREKESTNAGKLLNEERQWEVLLDPAFFVTPVAHGFSDEEAPPKDAFGIAMRLETWGIRVPPQYRLAFRKGQDKEKIKTTKAFQIVQQLADLILYRTPNPIELLIQSEADAMLASVLHDSIDSSHRSRLRITRPVSVADYLSRLSNLRALLTTRFHGVILAVNANCAVYPAYFAEHGHKIPGLHDLLALPRPTPSLSNLHPEQAAQMLYETLTDINGVPNVPDASHLECLRTRTHEWFAKSLLDVDTQSGDLKAAQLSLRWFGAELIHTQAENALSAANSATESLKRENANAVHRCESLVAEGEALRQEISKITMERNELSTELRVTRDTLRAARKELQAARWQRLPDEQKPLSELEKELVLRVGRTVVTRGKHPLRWPNAAKEVWAAYKKYKSQTIPRTAIEGPDTGARRDRDSVARSAGPRSQSPHARKEIHAGRPFYGIDFEKINEWLQRDHASRLAARESVLCYVVHNALPFTTGGYATRGHGLARGLKAAGWDVEVVTRPGFPEDIPRGPKRGEFAAVETIDGITYRRSLEISRKTHPPYKYIFAAAEIYAQHFTAIRPEIVVCASFATWTGLPALLACKDLGIPFVYEVRGLMEITNASRRSGYLQSEEFKILSRLEQRTATGADHVFTLTAGMRDELVSRGVDPAKISILPNSCDPDRFGPRPKDTTLLAELGFPEDAPVIGYVGTFVDYEGLEELARACAILKARGRVFRLLLVGSENVGGAKELGPIGRTITSLAQAGGFSDWLLMPGRVSHAEVERYYSLLDICPFPRKSWLVTEMVSPMKPLEAMAMQKCVLVTDVKALAEMVDDGRTGIVVSKDDVEQLASGLERLLDDPALRARLGRSARDWVTRERSWDKTAAHASQTLTHVSQAYPNNKRATDLPRARPTTEPSLQDARSTSRTETESEKAIDFAKSKLEPWFTADAEFIPLAAWELSETVQGVKAAYEAQFGSKVDSRIPIYNWKRVDFAISRMTPGDRILDIGPGLGEFVNSVSRARLFHEVHAIDVRDYGLYTDLDSVINKRKLNLFDLPEDDHFDVVTAFEVLEHLPPEDVAPAVQKIAAVAQRMYAVSMPLKERPLSKFHMTEFDEHAIRRYFPNGSKFVLIKDQYRNTRWIYVEVHK